MIRLTCCLIISILCARGEPGVGEIAVGYLKSLAKDDIEITRDTALFANTTPEKRDTIRRRLARLAPELVGGRLDVSAEKIEGDFAAVLVSQITNYDPSGIRIHAVPLLRRDGRWLPAPVPASFENTGVTYLPEASKATAALTDWMLRERVIRLDRLRETVQADLLAEIRRAHTRDELHEKPPDQLLLDFIAACQRRDLPAALAFLGGLEDPLPETWRETLQTTATALTGGGVQTGQWDRLLSESAARAVVHREVGKETALVSIGEAEPDETRPGRPLFSVLHFNFERAAGDLWRLRLPDWLTVDLPDWDDDPIDADLRDRIPAVLLEEHPPLPGTDPEALLEPFLRALATRSFADLLPYFSRDGDPTAIVQHAAGLWRDYQGAFPLYPLLLETKIDGDTGGSLICHLDPRSPRIAGHTIELLLLARGESGWLVAPPLEPGSGSDELTAWAEDAAKYNPEEWLKRAGQVAIIGGIPADSAPDDKTTVRLVQTWLDHLDDNLRGALRTAAAFDDRRGTEKLLRVLGQELSSQTGTEIIATHRVGRWVGATVRHVPDNPAEPAYHLLYPVITTGGGPRLLAEAILYHADTRSREFLNDAVWGRLNRRLPEEAVTELREVYQAHAEVCAGQP